MGFRPAAPAVRASVAACPRRSALNLAISVRSGRPVPPPRKPADFDDDDAPRKANVKLPAPGRAEKPKPGMEKARGRLTITS